MIINLNQFGSGGGSGSGYTLPIASDTTLGGVKIGDGINIDSAGTISADNQGVEIVNSLPSSGYDGQTVMLVEHLQHIELTISTPRGNNDPISVTAIGLTNSIEVYNYEYFGERVRVTVNTDNSVSLYNDNTQETTTFNVGDTGEQYTFPNHTNLTLTITVIESGFTISANTSVGKNDFVQDIYQRPQEVETLYTWSDNELLSSDIDYTLSGEWCVRFKYSELPQGTLFVWKYQYGEDYRHLVYENGELKAYTSNSPTAITATTGYVISQYSYITERHATIYWTNDEVVVYKNGFATMVSINTDLFYKTGWHKESEHRISNKAFYNSFTWFDEDNGIIIRNQNYPLNNVALKLNPTNNSNIPFEVYSKNTNNIGPFFAPTTTGTTGYVCVAGNGWTAPTWAEPSTLTNGVKFWKGTQDQYDALSGTGYDSSTLYIIIPE